MSQKRSNSHCMNRSKTSSCHDVDNGKAEQVCPSGAAFDELQNDIERELQNSKRVLSAVNNYLGSTSRNCPNRRNPTTPRVEKFSRLHQTRSPDAVNMKKTPLRVNLSSDNRSMQSLPGEEQFESSPHHHHHHHSNNHHHNHHYERDGGSPIMNQKSLQSISHLSKLKKNSSHMCEFDEGSDAHQVCNPKVKGKKKVGSKVVRLPEAPPLMKEQIQELIKCETLDVESAWYLTSEEKRTYQKPCPKQQKTLMGIKNLTQSAMKSSEICGTKYSQKLEHPEPEDISPDMAAAMMFLQEQGMKMEECPDDTITRLFPQDPRPPLPEKGSVSVVNPSEKDQQKMMEKSVGVPSEGVSDSAYTRRMSGKGELGPQKSYDVDFAIGQSNREYVFVTEKPQRVNMVRYRGGSTPSWFPWYLSAFPDDEEGLKLAPSPSGLFYKAWLYSNPENIPANDVIVLD